MTVIYLSDFALAKLVSVRLILVMKCLCAIVLLPKINICQISEKDTMKTNFRWYIVKLYLFDSFVLL